MPCGGSFFSAEPRRGPMALILAGTLLLSPAAPFLEITPAQGASAQPKSRSQGNRPSTPPYRSAILINAKTGDVLRSHNPRLPVIPASIVKMMTTFLALEHIRQKKARMADRVKISRAASQVGGHQVYLRQGEVFQFEDLLKAVMISSANDAAYAVAEHVAGNEPAFVRLMNQRARQLGLNETRFVNVNGLPAGHGKPSNLMSARDAAMLARRLIKDFPFVLEWTSTRVAPFRPGKFNLHNTNRLVGRFEGLDGLKTGFTPEAGFSVVATAQRGELRLISVVFGSRQSQRRFQEAQNLLAWGFSHDPARAAEKKPSGGTQKTKVLNRNPGGASIENGDKTRRLTLESGDARPSESAVGPDRPEDPGALLAAQTPPKPGVIHIRK